ncbi:hypothetical protein TIFTF001_043195 [Ficus carica]|uniref:Uncharacterized protein n=1 Tax=Ficus carica TaxID=3494 RepID=A0AA87YRC6_FICCA|nr:hypothetical protein TIFTF001_043182 [Ficus carica]GMN20843.1 hypothetical protein TIFTF001_043187 [Ficus carica]GMN20857.1 hypothetical protein TIFTF001_043190 [Ficus carica]GMN20874.1 hypothetical protein TIFTF001_043195 [Ficus carica]
MCCLLFALSCKIYELGLMTGHRPELEVPDQDPLPSQAPNLCGSRTTELGLMTGHRPELEVLDQDPLPSLAPNLCDSRTTELGLMTGHRPELEVPDQDPPAGSHVCNRPKLELDEKHSNQLGGSTLQYTNHVATATR